MAISVVSSAELSVWANGFSGLSVNTNYLDGDFIVVLVMNSGAVSPPTNGWTTVGVTTSNSLTMFYKKMTSNGSTVPLTGFSGSGKVSWILVRGAGTVVHAGNYSGAAQTINTGKPEGAFVISTTGNAGGIGSPYTTSGWTRLSSSQWSTTDYYTMVWKSVSAGTFSTPAHDLWYLNENYLMFSNETFLHLPSTLVVGKASSDLSSSATVLSRSNIAGSVDVKHHSSVGSSIYPLYRSNIPAQINVYEKSLLPSSINVPKYEHLNSQLAVRENNTMGATAFIWGVRESDLNTTITVNKYADSRLDSRIAVRESNTMDGKAEIYGRDESNIPSSLFAMGVGKSGISGRIGVRLRNSMTGLTDIWGAVDSEIESNVNVKQVADLPMTVGVSPSNRMTAIVDVQPPTRVTDVVTAKRDAFIREYYPKLNYGGEQTIVAGYSQSKAEIFRSILGFDITNILNMSDDYKIEKVVVKFKHSLGRTPAIPLELRTAIGTWSEFGVTWNNQPDSGEVVNVGDYEVNTDKGFITFDVTEYVLQAKEQGTSAVDFYLRAVNETDDSVQFFSKDAGAAQAPSIEYTYFDEVIRSTGRAGLDSHIFVTHPASKSLASKITVFKKPGEKDLTSKVNVTPSGNRYENLPSTLKVSRPNLSGKGTIQVNTWANLTSKIAVREGDLNDLENCTITVSRPNLKQTLYVANRKDVTSRLGVRVEAEDILYGWVSVNVKERPASIYVRPYYDKVGKVAVRRSSEEDLGGTFIISERNKLGTIYVLYRSDLSSTMTARGGVDVDIPSSITANQYQLLGKVTVNPYVDYKGKITVRRSWDTKIDGSIAVNRPNLNASVYVKNRSDLSGAVAVRRDGQTELGGQVIASRPSLVSSIFPRINTDLAGTVTVRRLDVSGINTTLVVPYRKNLLSEINVVGASMLQSSIQVNSGYLRGRIEVPAYGMAGLAGNLSVRTRLASDLNAAVDVYQFSTIDGNVTVRQFFEKSFTGTVTVRCADESNLPASMAVWITRNLTGSVTVRRSENADLNSVVAVPNHNDINGSASVPSRKDLNSRILVMMAAKSDMPSQVLAKIRSHSDLQSMLEVTKGGGRDLLTTIGVSATNRMTGVVDIVQSVREQATMGAVKDSYVREDVPTLNYGEETTFAVGRYGNSILRSLVGFDLTNLKDSYLVEEVDLRMYYGQTPTKNLKLFAVDGDWSETGVTWLNKPAQGIEVTDAYTVNSQEGYATFNVKQFIEENYLAGNNLVSFYVVAGDESEAGYSYFFSREGSRPPQLVVTYYNPAIWSFGRANIDSSIRVASRSNLASKLRIKVPAWLGVDVKGSLEVTRNNEFVGLAAVSRPDMLSTILAVHRTNSDKPATLAVAEKSFSTVGASIAVSKPEIPIRFQVRNRVDLPAKVTARVPEEQDFFSWLIVNSKERPAKIYVLPHSDIQLSFTVRGKTGDDLKSQVAVSAPDFGGSVIVKPTVNKDLTSKIKVRRGWEEAITGSVTVRQQVGRDLYSEILVHVEYVGGESDLTSAINIRTNEGHTDLPAALTVTRDSLKVTFEVMSKKDMPSRLTVVPAWFEFMQGAVMVSKPEIHSSLGVTLPVDLPATITAKASGSASLDGAVAVSRPDLALALTVGERSDIDSELEVRSSGDAEVVGGVAVSRPDAESSLTVIPTKDIVSSLNVMHRDKDDWGGKVYVKYMNDIVGTLEVVGANMIPSSIRVISGNLASVIAVPAYANTDLTGTVGVKSRYITEIPSSLQVQEWSQLVGTLLPKVSGSSDKVGKLKVVVTGSDALPSTIDIVHMLQDYLPSRIAVTVSNTMDGKADIVGQGNGDLVSTIRPVVSYNMPSRLGVRFDNSMTGEIDFIPVGDADLNGSVDVSPASNLAGSILVVMNEKYDMQSSLNVRAKSEKDIPANVNVIYRVSGDLPTTLGVPIANKMTGKVFIIPVGDSELVSSIEAHVHKNLTSKLTVRARGDKELTSKIEVHLYSELAGSVTARRSASKDLTSKITARVFGSYDKSGKITVRQKADRDLSGSINTIQWKVLSSRITVRRSAFSEIPMRFVIPEKNDLNSAITVSRTEVADLTSTISVRRSADRDLDGVIVARQSDKSEILSSIETWQFRTVPSQLYVLHRSDIVSTIEVVADYGYCFIM